MPAIQEPDVSSSESPDGNDVIIGIAFRRSIQVLIVAVLVVGGLYAYLHYAGRQPVSKHIPAPVPIAKQREYGAIPLPRIPFLDITREAGINFIHENGAAGEKLLPETMGGGCAFLDYDNDGDQDLLFINSCRWPWDDRPPPKHPPTLQLYENDGRGHFTDVTIKTKLNLTLYAQGVAVGDYDNDGDIDIFISALGYNKLLRNEGGYFTDVTNEAGIAGDPDRWSTSCGWFDYDNDGDLDLFVCNYLQWSREYDLAQNFQLLGGAGRAYGRPQNFPGTFPYLYRNDGEGHFKEVAEEAGIHVRNPATGVPAAKSLGVTFADLDFDGWLDIIVANDTVQNFLFHNLGNGTFAEMAVASGIAYDNDGNARGAMGIDCSLFRNNRQWGIAIGNFSNEMSALYVLQSHHPLQFVDEAIATGLGPLTRLELTFATMFVDLDLDGRMDIFSANGHLENEINRVQESQHYEQPPHLFWNAGIESPTEFLPLSSEQCGPDIFRPTVGRGGAYADIDGDGDLDLVVVSCGQPARLFRNDQQLNHHWLRVQLEGVKSNRNGIGALIEVHTGDVVIRQQVMPSKSYLSQVELPVTFGLHRHSHADKLIIRWPSGITQQLLKISGDQTLKLKEPESSLD